MHGSALIHFSKTFHQLKGYCSYKGFGIFSVILRSER